MSKTATRNAVLLLLAIFLGGFAAGVALQDWIEELPIPFFASDRDYDDDLEDVIDSEERLLRRLHLTAAQQDSASRILSQREAALFDYWEQRIPEMRQIIDASRVELRALLNAEQRARYDEGLNEILRAAAADRD
jgi:hypothetical protein